MAPSEKTIPSNCKVCENKSCLLQKSSPLLWKFLEFHKNPLTVKAKSPVFIQGDEVHGIFFIYSGKVKVTTQGLNGKTQIIRLAREGEILGHRGYSGDKVYHVSAIALEDCQICYIDHKGFMDLLAVCHNLAIALAMFYARELGVADERLRVMATQSNLQKIADAILMGQKAFGMEEDGTTLAFSLSRRELGEIAGTVPDVVSRNLAKLVDLKLIILNGKKISVPNVDLLNEYVHRPPVS